MSDRDPFGSDDQPFGGLPFFGDLARMLSQQGPMSWDAAQQLALSIATDGGGQSEANIEPVDRIALEGLARVAELQVASATGLSTTLTGQGMSLTAWNRTTWVRRALAAYRPWFDELAGSLQPALDPDDMDDADDPTGFLGPLMKMLSPMMLGMTAGSMVGHMARRHFGVYSLPLPWPDDQLGVILPNVDAFGEDWSLATDDLRLWVCLHEVAHHAVLRVPHIRAGLEQMLHAFLGGFEPDPSGLERRLGALDLTGDPNAGIQSIFGDPEALLGAMRSPAQEAMADDLSAIVAVVEGVVDHVLNTVGEGLLTSYGQVSEAMRRRRVEAGQGDRFVERLLGLELTQATLDRGGAFVSGVLERGDTDALARLWRDEHGLPTPAEVDAPGLWLARLDLHTD